MLVNVVDDDVTYPYLHIVASILAWASAIINPFIYAFKNRQYQQAFAKVKIRFFRVYDIFQNFSQLYAERYSLQPISRFYQQILCCTDDHNGFASGRVSICGTKKRLKIFGGADKKDTENKDCKHSTVGDKGVATCTASSSRTFLSDAMPHSTNKNVNGAQAVTAPTFPIGNLQVPGPVLGVKQDTTNLGNGEVNQYFIKANSTRENLRIFLQIFF